MPTVEIAAHVIVPAGADQVWALAMDWDRQRDWMLATQVSGGTGAGAQVQGRTGLGPLGFTDTMEITEWDPPRRCLVAHTGPLVCGTGRFEVTPAGAVSQFSWTETLQLPPALPGAVVRGLLVPAGRWLMATSLRRFARLVPAGQH